MTGERYESEEEFVESAFIRLSIERAERTGYPISDAAARVIASQLHGGQASAMYSLASCGAIDELDLEREITIDLTDPNLDEEVAQWYYHISEYATDRGDRGPVQDWNLLTRDDRLAELLGQLALDEDGDA